MKQEQFSSSTPVSSCLLPIRWLCVAGGVGLWGSSMMLATSPTWAEAEATNEAPQAAESVAPIAPVETSAELLLQPQVTASPTPSSESAPSLNPAPNPVVDAAPVVTEVAPATGAELVAPRVEIIESESAASSTPEINGVFIDPTDYSLGATPSPDSPSLIFTDRSTGCQFALGQGSASPTRLCRSRNSTTHSPGNSGIAATNSLESDALVSDSSPGLSLGPVGVSRRGVTVGGTTVISREYFNEKLRPLNVLRRGAEEFVFPLAMPAPITSLFGWRQHPIFGDRRFHTGTDLGAPEGTPVVATKDGEVAIADYLGGYGLTVILHHEAGTQETRYAHLSRILVRPGESVKQGDVVGLVGSTGNSTGPHLHFELRELTAQGWVLINPNELMSYTVASLVDVISNPLQALGFDPDAEDSSTTEGSSDLPYRPAQPNAS